MTAVATPTISTAPIASGKPIIDALTGVRGLAAIWIVIYHFRQEWAILFPSLMRLEPLLYHGKLAVDLFFILSGFVLAYNYLERFRDTRGIDRHRVGHFLFMRLARVYPVHLFTMLVLIALVVAAKLAHHPVNPVQHNPRDLVPNILLLHAWTPHLSYSWNYPSWSISCEWFAYLLFPFLCLPLARLTRGWQLLTAAAVMLAAAVVIGLDRFEHTMPFRELARVASEFILGCLLFRLTRLEPRRAAWLDVAVLIAGVAVLAVPFIFDQPTFALLILFTVLVYGLGRSHDRYVAFLRTAPLLFLGEISYSLYMTHAVAQKFLYSAVRVDRFEHAALAVRVGVVLAEICLIALGGIATTYLVERPARNRLRTLVREPKARDLAHEETALPAAVTAA